MPNRWLHEFFDIMAQGRSGWKIHKAKDEPAKVLGKTHRQLLHDYYARLSIFFQNKGLLLETKISKASDFVEVLRVLPSGSLSFVDATELTHEYLDEIWSSLSLEQKRGWTQTFRFVILHPEEFPKLITIEDTNLPEFKKLQAYVRTSDVSLLC